MTPEEHQQFVRDITTDYLIGNMHHWDTAEVAGFLLEEIARLNETIAALRAGQGTYTGDTR